MHTDMYTCLCGVYLPTELATESPTALPCCKPKVSSPQLLSQTSHEPSGQEGACGDCSPRTLSLLTHATPFFLLPKSKQTRRFLKNNSLLLLLLFLFLVLVFEYDNINSLFVSGDFKVYIQIKTYICIHNAYV